MRRINTGVTGRPLLARLVSIDDTIRSLVPNADITLNPDGTGDVIIDSTAQFKVNDTTNSTSTATGGAVFAGGIGVANNGYFGGDLTAAGGDITTVSNGFSTTGSTSGYIQLPRGTTAQRPGSPSAGYMRFNTSYGLPEVYNGSSWVVMGFKDVDVSSGRTTSSWETNWCTAGGFTITLPASPAKGDRIRFFDCAKVFDTNNLTVARNGKLIQGDAANLTVNTEGAAFELVFYNNTYGWRIFTI